MNIIYILHIYIYIAFYLEFKDKMTKVNCVKIWGTLHFYYNFSSQSLYIIT